MTAILQPTDSVMTCAALKTPDDRTFLQRSFAIRADHFTHVMNYNAQKVKLSAGLLVYRTRNGITEVFLIHPGGPFWDKKDAGAWSIPKGELDDQEEPIEAARREFKEETGFETPGPFLKLTPVKQSAYKIVEAWAMEGDYDPLKLTCNTFTAEWPPKSGQIMHFPEADQAGWFTIPEARTKILKGQIPLLDELEKILE